MGNILKRMITNIIIWIDRDSHIGKDGFGRQSIMLSYPEKRFNFGRAFDFPKPKKIHIILVSGPSNSV